MGGNPAVFFRSPTVKKTMPTVNTHYVQIMVLDSVGIGFKGTVTWTALKPSFTFSGRYRADLTNDLTRGLQKGGGGPNIFSQ